MKIEKEISSWARALYLSLEQHPEKSDEIFANLKMDGTNWEVLKIPAGGFKKPSSLETAQLISDLSGNLRAEDHLVMQGDAVFSFVQTEVPILIEDILKQANKTKEEIDFFMFHQPNKFMLQKLADRLEIPYDKMPCNIVENFGNARGL
jgi:3-oxoacyl-[acyl-carrier-protein] synthase-3